MPAPQVLSGPESRVRAKEAVRRGEEAGTVELVLACRQKNQEAWAELVRRYAPLVWTVARSHRLGVQDCEEVVQQTWLKVYQKLGALHSPTRFSAWLTTCARRESLRQVDRCARYVPVGGGTELDPDPQQATEAGPESTLLRRERRSTVLAALRRLPRRDQALLSLLSDDRHNYTEVSRLLGIARGSVGPLRARALRRLAGELEAEGVTAAAG